MPSPALPQLVPRRADAHKGDFGRALLVGGSRGMSGAIALAGMSALRSGAGLVTLAVPEAIQPVVASFEPSYMTMTLPQDEEGRIAQSATDVIISHGTASTAVACGPGLGRSAELDQVVATLYGQLACPMVVDAAALNALADQSEVLS